MLFPAITYTKEILQNKIPESYFMTKKVLLFYVFKNKLWCHSHKKYLVTLPAIIYVSCSKSISFQWHKHLLKFFHATYGSIIKSMYDKTNTTMIMFRHIFILRKRAARHTEYVNIMKKYDILNINVDLKFRPLKPCHISKCYQVACSPNTI